MQRPKFVHWDFVFQLKNIGSVDRVSQHMIVRWKKAEEDQNINMIVR